MKPDPRAVASQHIHIFRCLGNLARGSLVNCHPHLPPGGYDVGFGMYHLTVHAPFATFEEAREYALGIRRMLEIVIRYDREDKPVTHERSIETLQEVDVFDGSSAYVTIEHYLGKYQNIIKGLRRCRYGWLARWDTRKAWKEWRKRTLNDDQWYAWEGESKPEGPKSIILCVPPKGDIYHLPDAPTLEERLQKFSAEHPEVPTCYTIDPEYDLLVKAGVDEWRAESVLGLFNPQIEVVWNHDVKHGGLDPRFAEEAKAIIRRCAEQAGVKLDPI